MCYGGYRYRNLPVLTTNKTGSFTEHRYDHILKYPDHPDIPLLQQYLQWNLQHQLHENELLRPELHAPLDSACASISNTRMCRFLCSYSHCRLLNDLCDFFHSSMFMRMLMLYAYVHDDVHDSPHDCVHNALYMISHFHADIPYHDRDYPVPE